MKETKNSLEKLCLISPTSQKLGKLRIMCHMSKFVTADSFEKNLRKAQISSCHKFVIEVKELL